jgi:hydroxymethylglutaryl-CoA synthase
MSDIGITSFGAYIPKKRLNRQAIADANAWMNRALASMGKGTKAICNWDEDALTMAVEATRNAIAGGDTSAVSALYFASTTHPFVDRHNAGVITAALNLPEDIRSLDIGGSQRAGSSALAEGLASVGNGTTIVVASDARPAKPGSVQEMQFGDAAAALCLGSDNVIAKYLGGHSVALDMVDHYRAAGADYDYALEDRWIKEMGYDQIVPDAGKKALEKAGLNASDIDHFVMPTRQRRLDGAMAKAIGIDAGAIRGNLNPEIGEAGTAHAMVMLIDALEDAEPGQKIMVVTFGQGTDVLIFETTDALKTLGARRGVAATLATGSIEDIYTRYLSFRQILPYEWGIRAERDNRTAQSTFFRKRDSITSFIGGNCEQCGTLQFPKTRVCVNPNCQAIDTQVDHPFADMPASVKTFTEDNLAYSPSPPYQYGNVAFKEGGNIFMEMTDFEAGDLEIGTELKMVFRIKDFDHKRSFRRYFWKAAPADDT